MRRILRRHRIDVFHKPVSAATDRLDIFALSLPFAQDTSKQRDVLVEVVLFHDCFRPYLSEQFVFANKVAVLSDKYTESLESLLRERDLYSITKQKPLADVEP